MLYCCAVSRSAGTPPCLRPPAARLLSFFHATSLYGIVRVPATSATEGSSLQLCLPGYKRSFHYMAATATPLRLGGGWTCMLSVRWMPFFCNLVAFPTPAFPICVPHCLYNPLHLPSPLGVLENCAQCDTLPLLVSCMPERRVLKAREEKVHLVP
jgi:hypothetical protein